MDDSKDVFGKEELNPTIRKVMVIKLKENYIVISMSLAKKFHYSRHDEEIEEIRNMVCAGMVGPFGAMHSIHLSSHGGWNV